MSTETEALARRLLADGYAKLFQSHKAAALRWHAKQGDCTSDSMAMFDSATTHYGTVITFWQCMACSKATMVDVESN